MVSPFVLKELESYINNVDLGIRSKYRANIIYEIFRSGSVSRSSLESHLKLRRGTISSVIQELEHIGLVKEEKPSTPPGQGRPRIILSLNSERFVVLSFYIEGLRLRGGIVSLNEDLLYENELKIPKNADGAEFIDSFVRLWGVLVANCPPGAEIVAGSFSPVGCVQSDEKIWISTNRWHSVRNVDFRQVEKLVGHTIILRRNLEAILSYEISRNPEYAKNRTVLIHWGYGIGSAYSYDGDVLKNERGTYTGIGHIQVNPNSTRQCQCGEMGCLEAESALWSLLPCIAELQVESTEEAVDRPEILSGLSPDAHECFESAMRYFQIGLKSLCKIFAPDHLLFLSPLSNNRYVSDLIVQTVQTAFPESFQYKPTINDIGTSFHSCMYANAQPIIKATLERLIRTE